MRGDVAGLVEALLALHQPGDRYNGLGHALEQSCCGETWPCATVRLVAEVTGSPCPEPRMTAQHGHWHHDGDICCQRRAGPASSVPAS